jgi:hypothetical protein
MAHSLPKDDSFSDNALGNNGGPRWTKPTLYWPTQLWTNAAESVTGYSLATDLGVLHDGYSSDGTFASKNATVSTTARLANAYTFANYQGEDVSVIGHFRIRQVSGQDSFTQDKIVVGLIARVTGDAGTDFVNDTDISYEEALQSPRYYAFVRISRAPGGTPIANYQFWRVTEPSSAGSDSIIDVLKGHPSDPGGPSNSPNIATEMAAGKTFGMRFAVTTNGSVAELRGYWIDEFGTETEVLSYDDGDSTAILETGLCGSILTAEMIGPDHTSGSDRGVMGMVDFEIQNSSGVIQVRDEFNRAMSLVADRAAADLHGNRGQIVISKYTGDQGTEGDATDRPVFDDRLQRGVSLERLEMDSGVGWHLMHDPAPNPYVQARSIEYVMPSTSGGASGTRIIGLALRASATEGATFTSTVSDDIVGYLVAVELSLPGVVWAARVRRYNGLGAEIVASRLLNQSGDATSFAINATEKLSFAIENRDGGSAADGNVHLDILFSDIRLKHWTIVDGSGFIEEDDGSLTDTSTSRVLSGEGLGFYASDDNNSGLYVNSFTDDDPVFALTDQEQDGIFIFNEQEGKTGTLSVPHEWPVRVEYISYDVAHKMDSAHVHRHPAAGAQRRKWTIESKAAKKSEVDTLRDFFRDHGGSDLPFDWTTPDSEAVVARMLPGRITIAKRGPVAYKFSVELMECLGSDAPVGATLDFKSTLVPASGGGVGRVETPSGDRTHPVWHYKDDGVDVAKIEMVVTLPSAATGAIRVGYSILASSTAVEGTNYSIDSGSESPIVFASGDTQKTISFTLINPSEYYSERLLAVRLDSAGSDIPLDEIDNELHAYIRTTTAPPTIEFTSSGQTSPRASTATFTIAKTSGSTAHTDNIRVWLEADAGSTATEGQGDDYEWVDDPLGSVSIAPGSNSVTVSIDILPTATNTQFIDVNLRHELDDESEKNRWTQTTKLGPKERSNNTTKLFPGEPSDMTPGPASINIPDPWYHFLDDDVKTPWGLRCPGIQMAEDAIGSPYHRKSGEGFLHCNGNEEGLIEMPLWQRFSMYIEKPTEVDGLRTMPRFIRLGFRDRGFQLWNNQAASLAGSDENYGAVFDREATGSGVISHSTGEWRVWEQGTDNLGSGSDYGIEEETIRDYQGNYNTYIRIWVTLYQDDPNRLGDATNIIWWPFWFNSGDGTRDAGVNLSNSRGKAICAFWPMWEYGSTPLTGPPGAFHHRRGIFWEPDGNAVINASGVNTHRITVG